MLGRQHAPSEQAVGQDVAGAKEKGLAESSSNDGPNPAKPDKPVKPAAKTTKPADKTTDAHNKLHNVFDKFRSDTDEKLFNFTESGEVLLLKAKAIESDLEWLKQREAKMLGYLWQVAKKLSKAEDRIEAAEHYEEQTDGALASQHELVERLATLQHQAKHDIIDMQIQIKKLEGERRRVTFAER